MERKEEAAAAQKAKAVAAQQRAPAKNKSPAK
jgi:hypothetical protein